MATSTSEPIKELGEVLDAALNTFGPVPSWVRLRDEVSLKLHPPRPPVIESPAVRSVTAPVGEEIRVPFRILSGDKPVRWLIESVSSEAVASQLRLTGGLLSGWTPKIEHSGTSMRVVVAVENHGGRDSTEIRISVPEIEPLVVTEIGPSLQPVEAGGIGDDELRPGDRIVVESEASGQEGPAAGTIVSLLQPPLPPGFRWVLFDSPEGRFSVRSIRESSIHLLSRLQVGDRVRVLSARQRRLRQLTTAADFSGTESGEQTDGEISRHHGTQCIVTLDRGSTLHCFTEALVAAESPFLGPDQCSYLGYADYVVRWFVPGMRVGSRPHPEQVGSSWTREGRSFNVRWDDGSTQNVPADQLLVFG
jgi:hypothetical protein